MLALTSALDLTPVLDTSTHESDTETRKYVEHGVERLLRRTWTIKYNPGGLPLRVKPGLAHRAKPDFNFSGNMFDQICAKPGFSIARLYGLPSSVQMSCWAWDLTCLGWVHCGEAYLSEGPILLRRNFDLASVGCIYTLIAEPAAIGHLARQTLVQSPLLERYWAVYLQYTHI